jgi:hypothetical protein
MTLIASFESSSVPILFGDLLISGPEKIGTSLQIPGIGSVQQNFPENRYGGRHDY